MVARAGDSTALKIVHIEDNPDNRRLVRAVLGHEGYTIVDAPDALSGIEAAVREQPALVLLDINLPDMEGYEVAGLLKSFPALESTAIIAVTAYSLEGDRQRTLVAGCDGYIQKPIDVDRFPEQIAEFLRGRRERVDSAEEGVYLRELNQRLVYRMVQQVEELKRLNTRFVRRAGQLENLHGAFQNVTADVGVEKLVEHLVPGVARALGLTSLSLDVAAGPDLRLAVQTGATERTAEEAAAPVDETATVPVVIHGRPLGTMSARGMHPSEHDDNILKLVADQIAIAIENARLLTETDRRRRTAESLAEVGRLLSGTLDSSLVAQRIADSVRVLFGAQMAAVRRVDVDTRELRTVAVSGEGGAVVQDITFRIDHGMMGLAIRECAPMATTDMLADERVVYEPETRARLELAPFRALLAVPLLVRDRASGVLVVGDRVGRQFQPDEISLAQAFADQAAVALENAELYGQVAGKNAELTAANHALAAALRLQTEFLANTSHEMRTPLYSFLGLLRLIVDGLCEGPDEERALIGQAYADAKHLLSIVDDILDMAKIEAGKLEIDFGAVELPALFEEVKAIVRPQADAKSLQLVVPPVRPEASEVFADARRLKQVLLNLVANSIKFTETGTVTVAAVWDRAGDAVTISVTDTGIGVAAEQQARLFENFVQADGGTSRKYGGTGLGLSISKRLVHLMNGSIRLESEGEGKGTTVTVTLPRSGPGHGAAMTAVAVAGASA